MEMVNDELLVPHGLTGEVVSWIRDSAGMYQPRFALAAGLAVCGALLSRIVKDEDGQRTNLYTLAIGGTSAGKNGPIQAIQKLMISLCRGIVVIGEPTSDSALEVTLDAHPVRFLVLDEVGHYLGSLKKAGPSNGHLRTVMPMLTKAWSAAGGILEGKTRAPDTNGKWKPPKMINEPCVSFYGTSAPGVLFDSMTHDDFSDGSIPRFVCFISETRPAFVSKGELVVPTQLKELLSCVLANLNRNANVYTSEDTGNPRWIPPTVIKRTEDATRIFADFEKLKTAYMIEGDKGDEPLYLWGKAVENAKRIALIVAALDIGAESYPIIDTYAASYAVKLMKWTIGEFIEQVRANVAANAHEADVQRIERLIRKAGPGGIVISDITRKSQNLRRGDRDDILLDLTEAGRIRLVEEPGKGAKTITRYYCNG